MLAFLLFTVLYATFASAGLDDFDSYSFILALDQFNLTLTQPQPPGFPVYIGLGQLARTLTGDAQTGLALLSAASGGLAAVSLAGIGSALGYRGAGWLAGLTLAVTPGVWLHSAVALSDMPGLAFTLAAVWGLLRGADDPRVFWLGCALAGIALGVRPQNGIGPALAGLYAVWSLRGRWGVILAGFVVGGIAILIWLVPVAQSTGGLDGYLDALRAHGDHVASSDSLAGSGVTLSQRWEAFLRGWGWLVGPAVAPLVALLAVAGLIRVPWRDYRVGLLLIWFGLGVVRLFLLESIERPRLYLPSLAPLILLVALGWMRWPRPARLVAVAGVIVLFFNGIPRAAILHQQAPAPSQALAWIQADYPADSTVIVTGGSFRAAQVEAPVYPLLYTGQFDPAGWPQRIQDDAPRYIAVMDRDDIDPAVIEAVTGGYVPIADRVFERDWLAFPQHVTIRVQVFTPTDQLVPAQLRPPADGLIYAGLSDFGKHFGAGWFRSESIGGVAARWTGATATLRVTIPAQDTTMRFRVTPYPPEQAVSIQVNGVPIATRPLAGTWQEQTVLIPADAITADGVTEITFVHDRAETPDGSNRALAAAYDLIAFLPPSTTAFHPSTGGSCRPHLCGAGASPLTGRASR
jgi:hypothetical protein